MLHFSPKEQFEEAEPATLNGLDQPEQTTLPIPQLPQETPSSLEQEPEAHSLHLQPQHEESVLPTQSTLTADDMRRAKRIRVSGKRALAFLQSAGWKVLLSNLFTIHFEISHLAYPTLSPLILEEGVICVSVSLCPVAGRLGGWF